MEGDATLVVREITEAWNRRDIEEILALTDPRVEYVNPPNAMEPGTRRGHEAMRDVTAKQWEALADARQEIERLHDRGDIVLVEMLLTRGMPDSEATVETRSLLSYSVGNGKVTRLEIVGTGPEFSEALKRVGLA